jgi:hypothetical protein
MTLTRKKKWFELCFKMKLALEDIKESLTWQFDERKYVACSYRFEQSFDRVKSEATRQDDGIKSYEGNEEGKQTT